MSKFIAALVIVAVCLGSVTVYGAEPSKTSLSALGLGGMQPMSDAQGSKVRGMGGTVWGSAGATGGATIFFSSQGVGVGAQYSASGQHFATGIAGAFVTTGFTTGFAFGTSTAF